MSSFVRPRRPLSYLGLAAALATAAAIAGLLAGLNSKESEAALGSRDVLVTVAISPQPAPNERAEPSRFAALVPAELLAPPRSLEVPRSQASTAVDFPAPAPQAPSAKSGDLTGSIAAVPLPRKRPVQEAKPGDQGRFESASAQIARIRTSLKLTPMQEPYWPPVEAALRDILTQLGYESGAPRGVQPKRASATASIDQERVQRLTSAAMPLLMTFDEAQKREVRRIARIMGLENVASAI